MASLKRAQLVATTIAVLGGLTTLLARDHARIAHSYLVAFLFALTIAVGALLWLMLGYAINASWHSALRRLSEATAIALAPLLLLFVPVALFARRLYPWLTTPHLEAWLNLPAFLARSALYLLVFLIPAWLLRRWSLHRAQDLARERTLSSAVLMPTVLALTFASFDWGMSLEPEWFSASYGLYILTGAGVGALAWLAIAARAVEPITPNHFHALGRALFAFVILWAYIGYFQLMLIDIADKPREVAFYLARSQGTWKLFGRALAIGHFALPVLLLAPRAVKLRPRYLAAIGSWLLLMHYADLYYLIMPLASPTHAAPSWLDLATLGAVVGSCVAFCARLQRDLPLIAVDDPELAVGLRYRSET